jgi:hypothetical protein
LTPWRAGHLARISRKELKMEWEYHLAQAFAKIFGISEEEGYERAKWGAGVKQALALVECRLYEKSGGKRRPRTYSTSVPPGTSLTATEVSILNRSLDLILPVLIRAAQAEDRGGGLSAEDHRALNQLKAIRRVVDPDLYRVTDRELTEFIKAHYPGASASRAWEMRRLMSQLSMCLTPVRGKSVLKGPVRRLSRRVAKGLFYKEVEEHWNSNSTLESLAVEIYRDHLKRDGISLESRSLKRDLQKMRRDERLQDRHDFPFGTVFPLPVTTFDPQGRLVNSEELAVGFFSDEWKTAHYSQTRRRSKKKSRRVKRKKVDDRLSR